MQYTTIENKTVNYSSGRTLRETVLESSPVLSLLNESFVSSWSLVKELEDLQSKQENEEHARLASLHLEHYNFPVEMLIALPNGVVVHHINANYFLDVTSMKQDEMDKGLFISSRFEDPSTAAYVQFLKEGLEKAKQFVPS